MLHGHALQDRAHLVALRDRRVRVRHDRLLARAEQAADAQPLDALLATKVIDGRVVGDAIEPRQDLVVFRQCAQRLIGLREHVLGDVVRELGIAEQPQEERVDASFVCAVERLDRIGLRLAGERDELRVRHAGQADLS